MRPRSIHLALLLVFLLLPILGSSLPARAQAGDPYGLIDAVNSLRAANGMPSYEANSILMSIAQAHSEYQAAIGQVTHSGEGGTAPRDRAAAAGYGGGGSFFISENIAGGTDLSVDGAISMWLGDAPHIQTMLGANYRDIGAGVAESNGFVYYTIDVAYMAGTGAGAGNYSPAASSTPGGPTPIPVYLVQTATPKPDGSITHTVRSGQTLEGIAKAYGISVAELKELNNLSGDAIYVGDTLQIQPANTPGPTSTIAPSATPTRRATSTHAPTRTPTSTPIPALTDTAELAVSAQKEAIQPASDALGNILVIAIIVLAVGGVLLMVVGSLIKRSSKG